MCAKFSIYCVLLSFTLSTFKLKRNLFGSVSIVSLLNVEEDCSLNISIGLQHFGPRCVWAWPLWSKGSLEATALVLLTWRHQEWWWRRVNVWLDETWNVFGRKSHTGAVDSLWTNISRFPFQLWTSRLRPVPIQCRWPGHVWREGCHQGAPHVCALSLSGKKVPTLLLHSAGRY